MNKIGYLTILVALTSGASACKKGDADELKRKAAEGATEMRKDVDDEAAKLHKDYDKAKAGADETAHEASGNVRATTEELHAWGHEKIGSLDSDIGAAKVKARDARAGARAQFDTSIHDVQAKRDVIAHDIQASTAEDRAKLDKLKDGFDTKVEHLKDRVDKLSKDL